MNIKSIFKRKEKINFENSPVQRFIEEKNNNDLYQIYYLDKKVDIFIDWWKNSLEGNYPIDYTEEDLRKLIEDVAEWYENIYPDYCLNGSINQIPRDHINDLLNNRLLEKERELFLKPKYPKYVRLWTIPNNITTNTCVGEIRFYLNDDGIVKDIDKPFVFNDHFFRPEEFIGKDIDKVAKILRMYHKASYAQLRDFNFTSMRYKDETTFNNLLLNSIMYRIIEKGKGNFGAKRGYLFAKEFRRNLDIPMSYGIDMNDPYMNKFIIDYLNNGGNNRLLCFIDYKNRLVDKENHLDVNYLSEIQKKINQEEYELYQRFVKVLKSQIDEETIQKEEIGIEKHLKKVNNKNKL